MSADSPVAMLNAMLQPWRDSVEDPAAAQQADLVLQNGVIYTGARALGRVEALAIQGERIVAGCRQRGLEAVFREVDLKAPTALEAVSREHDLVIFGTPPPRAFAGAVPFIRQLRGLPGPVVVFRPAPVS